MLIMNFSDKIDVFDAEILIRIRVLSFKLKNDALNEYNQSLAENVRRGTHKSIKAIIVVTSRRLEISELKMKNMNL